MDLKVRFKDPKPANEMIAVFQKIRKMRMRPAHQVDDCVFKQEYFKEQRKLMIEAYTAIRTLRLILANHPRTKDYKIPEWLHEGKIWTY